MSFFNDDWYFLLQRPGLDSGAGLDSLLAPHNSNLVALSAAVYKAMVLVFGLSSQIPYRMVLGAMIAGLGILIYLLVSARAGKVLGVAAAAVALFLGPAWEDLLFFASIDLIGSLVMGLGGLLALERDSPRRNAIACLMLIGAVGFSNLGIAFVVAAVVCVLVRRSPKQLWVPLCRSCCSRHGGSLTAAPSPLISRPRILSISRATCLTPRRRALPQ